MMFYRKQPPLNNVASEKLASAIASTIIEWKITLSTFLSRRANMYSKKRQKSLLLIYCVFFIAGLTGNFWKLKKNLEGSIPAPSVQTSHIGMPSNMPLIKRPFKTTYPLIIKNKSHGKFTAKSNDTKTQ